MPATATLGDYLTDLRRVLHDTNDTLWSAVDKTAWINRALKRRDLETGGNRQLFAFALTPGQDTYALTDIAAQVFDVVAINVIYGNLRYVLGQVAFTELNVIARQYSPPWQWVPQKWARYGPLQIVFGPAPSMAYVTEWDCCVYSNDLVELTDADPLPYPYTEPVPYYAAILAKENERQYDEAYSDFQQRWREAIATALNARTGVVPTMYAGR